MSYALRNTLILLVTLLLFVGGAYSYLEFVQRTQIESLTEELSSLNTDYNSKVQIRDQYQPLIERYNKAKEIVLGYDKKLFKSNNPDDVYNYLSEINSSNLELYYDYSFRDSVALTQYGILNSSINGAGIYADFVNFLNKIENSALLNKIENVSISPAPNLGSVEYVNFSLTLKSYYQKVKIGEENEIENPYKLNAEVSIFNPLKPLILESVPLNDENLVDVEQSRLIGLTSTRVFLINQEGKTKTLKPGDKVYLGYLKEINIQNNEVVFNLDKGGIQELFTLEVKR